MRRRKVVGKRREAVRALRARFYTVTHQGGTGDPGCDSTLFTFEAEGPAAHSLDDVLTLLQLPDCLEEVEQGALSVLDLVVWRDGRVCAVLTRNDSGDFTVTRPRLAVAVTRSLSLEPPPGAGDTGLTTRLEPERGVDGSTEKPLSVHQMHVRALLANHERDLERERERKRAGINRLLNSEPRVPRRTVDFPPSSATPDRVG